MFDRDKWLEILVTMVKNPLRTMLTSVSVAVGVFILVILSGMTNGFENGVHATMADDALNSIWVRARTTSLAYGGFQPNRRVRYENDDHHHARDNVDGVETSSARLTFWSTQVKWGKEVSNYGIRCVNPGHQEVERTAVETGRYISEGDVLEKRKVAVVGKNIVEELFHNANPVGELINIMGVNFKVIGTFDDGAGRWENRQIYLPISTGQMLFGKGSERIDMFIVGTGESTFDESERIASDIDGFLRQKHRVHPQDRRGVSVRNVNEEGQVIQGVFNGIRIFVWAMALLTLIVAVIGVSNIMSIIVKERTREFGVRKALGATPWSIVSLIIQESVFITLISGLLGVLIGTGLLLLVASFLENEVLQNPQVDFNLIVTALVLLVISGTFSGAIPALRAVSIKPVEALRDE